jgi:GNAT superfamily N-acetyltransferase
MALQVFTLRQRPDLGAAIFAEDFQASLWAEYLRHDHTAQLYYGAPFFERYLDFAFAALDDGKLVARAFSVPFAFGIADRRELPDGGWDEVIRWAHEDQALGRVPTAVSALEIGLRPQSRGSGLSRAMIEAMKANARALGFADLYAPVRPNQKHQHPEMPMTDYVAQRGADGLPADAWLRTHVRIGGEIVKVAPCSMTVVGTVAEWSRWTGLRFERSGPAIVPQALTPVHISLEHDQGVYVEPNVWVHHRL